jgi:hypothetical protein
MQCKASAADAAACQLSSREAVAGVWPLVEPLLLADVEHVARHKGEACGVILSKV